MKLVRDFLALSSGQVLSKLILFGGFAHLARTLEPERYGLVELAAALSMFAAIVVDLGLGVIGTRELAKDPKSVGRLTATIPAARLMTAVVVIPAMGFGARLMGQSDETVMLVWLFSIGLLALPWKQDWLLQGLEMMRGVAIGDLIRASTFTIGVLVFVRGPQDLLEVGGAEVLAAASAAVFYVGFQHFRIGPVRVRFSIEQIRDLFGQASHVGLSHVVWAVNQYVQLILLAGIVGGDKTAYFGASHRIVASLLIFSNLYHFNLFPALVRTNLGATESFNRLMGASFRIVAWGGVFVALAFTLLARPVLVFVFGEKFGVGAPVLGILIWALPVTALSGHARRALVVKNQQKRLLYAQLVGTVVTLFATPLLVLRYQAVGAAIGMIVANVAVWLAAHAYAKPHVSGLPSWALLVRPTALAISIALLCSMLGPSAWGIIGLLVVGLVSLPLVDRAVIPDLWRLAHAKSYRTETTEETAGEPQPGAGTTEWDSE